MKSEDVKLNSKEFFEMLANMFENGASGYYLSVGDWKLAAPYVLDLQDIALQLRKAEKEIEVLREQRTGLYFIAEKAATVKSEEKLDAEIKAAREEVK